MDSIELLTCFLCGEQCLAVAKTGLFCKPTLIASCGPFEEKSMEDINNHFLQSLFEFCTMI